MKVFVDTDSDIRLVRRLKRDISQRGRDISGIIKQYNKFVKPAFEQYIEPTVQAADIVVPRGQSGATGPILDAVVVVSAPEVLRVPTSFITLCFVLFFLFSFIQQRSGGENFVALDLIVQHVHSQLEKVSVLSSRGVQTL